jgi:UDP-N-acetyl-D-mannosaminuronate dehydrogenase
VDAAVVQCDHSAYRALGADDLPGVKVLVDGRNVTDPGRWDGVTRIVVGRGAAQQ